MITQWSEDLAIGIDEIDEQHKQLFDKIKRLLDAINQAKGKGEIAEVVQFLEDYVVTHFGTEEKYMASHHYPEYPYHKAEHRDFIVDFSHLKEVFNAQGASTILVIQIKHRLYTWLLNHIGRSDKALGAFLRQRRNESPIGEN